MKPSKKNQLEESLESQVAVVQESTENYAKKILDHQEQQNEMNTSKFEALQADIYQLSENVDKKMSYVIDLLHSVMENQAI